MKTNLSGNVSPTQKLHTLTLRYKQICGVLVFNGMLTQYAYFEQKSCPFKTISSSLITQSI